MTARALYTNFVRWHSVEMQRSGRPCSAKTFWSELEGIGIMRQKKLKFPSGKRPNKSVQLFASDVETGIRRLYALDAAIPLLDWPTEDETAFALMQTEIRGRSGGFAFIGDSTDV